MRIFVTCDADIDSGLNEVLNTLSSDGFDQHFQDKSYDDSGIKITIILMCRDPRWKFKQRIRFSKIENKLYLDILLDLDVMRSADFAARKRIVGEIISVEAPRIVAKYKFKDFDLPRFSSDLRDWFKKNGWIRAEYFPEFIE